MWAEAIRASNGPPGARLRMPNRSTEASISVTAISMLLRTRNLVIGNLGSGISAALTSWERRLFRPQLPTPGSQFLAQVPLPDVPRVAVRGVLRLPVSQPEYASNGYTWNVWEWDL